MDMLTGHSSFLEVREQLLGVSLFFCHVNSRSWGQQTSAFYPLIFHAKLVFIFVWSKLLVFSLNFWLFKGIRSFCPRFIEEFVHIFF